MTGGSSREMTASVLPAKPAQHSIKAPGLEHLAGRWECKYDGAYQTELRVQIDGRSEVKEIGGSADVPASLRLTSGYDLASGWHYRMEGHYPPGTYELIKYEVENGEAVLRIQLWAGAKHIEGHAMRSEDIQVHFERNCDADIELGVYFEPSDDGFALVIDRINEVDCLIRRWNKDVESNNRVHIGDHIVEVNGVGGSCEKMMETLKERRSTEDLHIKVRKGSPRQEPPPIDTFATPSVGSREPKGSREPRDLKSTRFEVADNSTSANGTVGEEDDHKDRQSSSGCASVLAAVCCCCLGSSGKDGKGKYAKIQDNDVANDDDGSHMSDKTQRLLCIPLLLCVMLLWCLWCIRKARLQGPVYDCSREASNGSSWTTDQSVWCCINQKIGCHRDRLKHDCQNIVDKSPNEDEKAWCCDNWRTGCPYDCKDHFDEWESKWPKFKKMWCCENQNRACEAKHPDPPSAASKDRLRKQRDPPEDIIVASNSVSVATVSMVVHEIDYAIIASNKQLQDAAARCVKKSINVGDVPEGSVVVTFHPNVFATQPMASLAVVATVLARDQPQRQSIENKADASATVGDAFVDCLNQAPGIRQRKSGSISVSDIRSPANAATASMKLQNIERRTADSANALRDGIKQQIAVESEVPPRQVSEVVFAKGEHADADIFAFVALLPTAHVSPASIESEIRSSRDLGKSIAQALAAIPGIAGDNADLLAVTDIQSPAFTQSPPPPPRNDVQRPQPDNGIGAICAKATTEMCHEGLNNFEAGWSAKKRKCCCKRFELGCPEGQSVDTPSRADNGHDAAYKHWASGSTAKTTEKPVSFESVEARNFDMNQFGRVED